MTLSKSQIILTLASIVTLGLTWQTFNDEQSNKTVLPTRVVADTPAKNNEQHMAVHQDLVLSERALVPLVEDLFFTPIVIKPKIYKKKTYKKKIEMPKVDLTPPLPFKYLGLWQDKQKQAVMIDYNGEVIMVKEGDIVGRQYKVQAINESLGRIQVEFLMMPLNKIQTLQAGVRRP